MLAKLLLIISGIKKTDMAPKTDNTKAQMRKGVLEYCLLLALRNKPAYASDLIEILKSAKLIVVEGTLYPLLNRLKNSGYLTYEWVESQMGPPRKYYRLTNAGEYFLQELEIAWNELVDGVTNIKTNHKS